VFEGYPNKIAITYLMMMTTCIIVRLDRESKHWEVCWADVAELIIQHLLSESIGFTYNFTLAATIYGLCSILQRVWVKTVWLKTWRGYEIPYRERGKMPWTARLDSSPTRGWCPSPLLIFDYTEKKEEFNQIFDSLVSWYVLIW